MKLKWVLGLNSKATPPLLLLKVLLSFSERPRIPTLSNQGVSILLARVSLFQVSIVDKVFLQPDQIVLPRNLQHLEVEVLNLQEVIVLITLSSRVRV